MTRWFPGCPCIKNDRFEIDSSCPIHGGDALDGPNRWAAFTDDELKQLSELMWGTDEKFPPVLEELLAEIDRRKIRPGHDWPNA